MPGGFIDYGESAESAARREAAEETNLEISGLRQFHVYSDPGRDPRMHTLTTVFVADGMGELCAGDDAQGVGVFQAEDLPGEMAFDHRSILDDYFSGRWDT